LVCFAIAGILVLTSLLAGVFGGREYMAYPPLLSLIILPGWLFFAFAYFRHFTRYVKNWPVYKWMWATGILFFIFTFCEAHLWVFSYFRENIIRDITVQWKSYGALVGSWNMLVYGTGIYIMYKIHGSETIARSKLAFALYFVGLFNLMFGWAHHCYIVPHNQWIRLIAYAVSMSELIILARIIFLWSKSLLSSVKFLHLTAYRFLFAADYWVAFNLLLAVLISIPAINFYTHGTYITVAHAMGTTIGINTSILLSAIIWIIQRESPGFTDKYAGLFRSGFYIFHISLIVFWCCLILGGIYKSLWMYSAGSNGFFSDMMAGLRPVFFLFLIAGIGIVTGLFMVILPSLQHLCRLLKTKSETRNAR
ncbi:MAG: cbb3-type cytochrome c oxidase subunit I, partial [Flavobacteriales bacterium]